MVYLQRNLIKMRIYL